jgi:hypothetical protein
VNIRLIVFLIVSQNPLGFSVYNNSSFSPYSEFFGTLRVANPTTERSITKDITRKN